MNCLQLNHKISFLITNNKKVNNHNNNNNYYKLHSLKKILKYIKIYNNLKLKYKAVINSTYILFMVSIY